MPLRSKNTDKTIPPRLNAVFDHATWKVNISFLTMTFRLTPSMSISMSCSYPAHVAHRLLIDLGGEHHKTRDDGIRELSSLCGIPFAYLARAKPVIEPWRGNLKAEVGKTSPQNQ